MATASNSQPADSPEVRRYNRIQRWLSLADTVIGFALLVVLLVTGWTGKLRDWSYLGASQHYFFAVFLYVLMFSLIAKVLSAPFDFVGFRLEHQYHLSNQKLRGWIWDECKGWLVSLVLGTIMVEMVYSIIRIAPQRWWIIAWAVFVGLFLLMAQLAPVVLMPIFYKFEPLNNDGLRERLTRLGERAGTRVRGVYEWKLSEKSNKANAALTGMGSTRRIILSDTLLQNYSDDEIEAVLAHELGHHVHKHILKSIFTQVGITLLRLLADQCGAALRDRERLVSGARSAALRLRQPAAHRAGGDGAGICADAGAECASRASTSARLIATPGKILRRSNRSSRAMQKLADQNLAEREPNKVDRVALPLASVDWEAGGGGRSMGQPAAAGGRREVTLHIGCLRLDHGGSSLRLHSARHFSICHPERQPRDLRFVCGGRIGLSILPTMLMSHRIGLRLGETAGPSARAEALGRDDSGRGDRLPGMVGILQWKTGPRSRYRFRRRIPSTRRKSSSVSTPTVS